MTDEIVVHDNPEGHRYEILVDGYLAGLAAYRLNPSVVVFTHTEIDPTFEGHGLGGRLAKAALDDVRLRGRHVIPLCPFISGYIRRHPEYFDLIDVGYRPEFESSAG